MQKLPDTASLGRSPEIIALREVLGLSWGMEIVLSAFAGDAIVGFTIAIPDLMA